ncbi:MAG: nitroreductase family protein [Verrucomicrobiota bacterium]|jgi:nitroreductase
MNAENTSRKADHAIHKVFLDLWSPRAFSGDEISQEDLMRLFEAARWAPSCYNHQPCRILYARRQTKPWTLFLNLLVEANKVWAKEAAALLVFVSKTTLDRDGKPSRTYAFDTGAAWENLALQACLMGLITHEMQGFDYARAKTDLGVPDGYEVQAMVAVGKQGRKENLPPELREREAPTDRRKLAETVFEGRFKSVPDLSPDYPL